MMILLAAPELIAQITQERRAQHIAEQSEAENRAEIGLSLRERP